MRRTISTLMFLVAGGLALAVHAADTNGYYGAGQSSFRISDDDDAAPPAGTRASGVATAVGQPGQPGKEANALYVADKSAMGNQLLQTSFFDSNCGCQDSCGGCNQGSCLSDCCDCDCSTNSFRFEWLGWFTRGRNAPPLVTTSDAGTVQASAGVLGLASTTTLYGGDPIGTNLRNGGRATLNHLFADGITTGTFRFWGIEDGSATFATTTADFPILGRPYFNAQLGQQDARLVGFPGVLAPGQIRVVSKNDLIGADAWVSRSLYDDGGSSVDVLGGYQFTRLDDSIAISSLATSIDPGAFLPVGSTIAIFDSFRTKNEFHGGTLGLLGRSYRGAITLEGLAKLGVGNNHQSVIINGNTTIDTGAGPATGNSGLLAQGSNSGTFTRNRFIFVPEINVNLVYNLNQSWRLIGGYSFIYYSSVVLAGNQIDTNVNPSQNPGPVVGPLVPVVKFQSSDFWVQGINLGADYRW
jgi:hypothetical protein